MTGPVDRLAAALAGRYGLERELGQGGMATVYLAEDPKHDRQVAIKVLKPELAAVLGAERFVQEIQTTAQLQHPNILPLFDSGEADGFLYYVMPYVQGETLREKLDREMQLGIEEAVRITTEVADALQYAHEQGVIHRDIKPENILLHAGRPMVADFGIALALSAAAGGRLTETGMSLGTPHYMSPEQATAEKTLTNRADIYSLGCVLYEMLTGDPPHTGKSAQQIIAKIVTDTPRPVTEIRKSVPANVAAATSKTLQRLPADRFETAKAFAEALTNPAFTVTSAAPAPSATLPLSHPATYVAAAAFLTLGALAAWGWLRPRSGGPPSGPPVRFTLTGDPGVIVETGSTSPYAVSADGRTIVFRASTDTTPPQLWVRHIGEAEARPLAGTEGGVNPAISPDDAWVAFLRQDGKTLYKVGLSGGDVTTVAKLDGETAALSWASNDEIIFEQIAPDLAIERVDAAGGKPERAIPFDSAASEVMQRSPVALGTTGVVVYASYVKGQDEPSLVLYRLSDAHRARLGLPGDHPLALIDHHLVYSRTDGTLMAVALDLQHLRATARPVPLEPHVGSNGAVGTSVGLSAAGTLVYRPANTRVVSRVELVDTAGVARQFPGEFTIQGPPRFSPDGRDIVVPIGAGAPADWFSAVTVPADLWIFDLTTGGPTRLTSGNVAAAPSWFPNGRRLMYSARVQDRWELWSVPVDGSAPPSRLADLPGDVFGAGALPGGRSAIVVTGHLSDVALARVWLDGSKRVDTLVATAGEVPFEPRVSPDGRWVAYLKVQGASWFAANVWVHSVAAGSALQVSASPTAGNPAVWGPDSRRLYYESGDGLVEIELQTSPTLAVLRRRTIRSFPSLARPYYDLSPDGKTFVVARPVNSAADVIVVLNWADQARQAWSAGGKP